VGMSNDRRNHSIDRRKARLIERMEEERKHNANILATFKPIIIGLYEARGCGHVK
jgi:hypothetical protein